MRAMTSAPITANSLPPYTIGQPCHACRRRAPALVVFDRDCHEVTGEHYHRECLACGARWLEQCARSSSA
jgi:hypothetical protein